MGYTIGGPVGKPGGANKVFFFFSQEFAPRTRGDNVTNYRMPTALERAGDFSQTTDNNGALYNFIRDPNLAGNCTAADQAACFRDGGVLGRIPANRLYATGIAILNRYPLPNLTPAQSAGLNYNFSNTRAKESVMSWQPALRVDYQPIASLRVSAKYSAWQQAKHTFIGTIPGFNDTRMQAAPVTSLALSANYTLNPTTFVEMTCGTQPESTRRLRAGPVGARARSSATRPCRSTTPRLSPRADSAICRSSTRMPRCSGRATTPSRR